MEMQTDETAEPPVRYLVFETNPEPETQALIDEFKGMLALDPDRSKFRVTSRLTRRKADEIVIRMRSMLALMGFVSRGVEVPGEHLKEARAIQVKFWADETDPALLMPLHVYALAEEPDDAFVTVRYQDHWFYLKRSDHRSKSAFGLLTYLFQLQAPAAPTAGPALTLPVGR